MNIASAMNNSTMITTSITKDRSQSLNILTAIDVSLEWILVHVYECPYYYIL